MARRVLLFDIDGTLVTTGGAGRRAMQRAFRELHGRDDAVSFPLDGMTDQAIVRRALGGLGVEATAGALEACLATYLRLLEEELAAVPPGLHRLHRGMRQAVELARQAGHAVGLGTGNVRSGARLKLHPLGLFEAFTFGGFGDDHEARPEILRAGADRGRVALGRPEAHVVVIGDTPHDVSAAQAIGATCVAVATGSFSVEQLLEAGATVAFQHLEQPGALDAVLGPLDAAR